MTKKKTVKKPVAKKKVDNKVVKTKALKIKSFTIASILPTVSYGNYQPSLTVENVTQEQIENEVIPYFKRVEKKLFERVEEVEAQVQEKPKPKKTIEKKEVKKEVKTKVETLKDKNELYQSAVALISASESIPGLEKIKEKISSSKKLSQEQIGNLLEKITEKMVEVDDFLPGEGA